jgi:hypothetical protein
VYEGGGVQQLFPQSADQKRATRQAYESALVTVAKGGKVAASNTLPRNRCRTTKAGISCNVDGKTRRFKLVGGNLGRAGVSPREPHAIVISAGDIATRRAPLTGQVVFYPDSLAVFQGVKYWSRSADSFTWADEFELSTAGWIWRSGTFAGEGGGQRAGSSSQPSAAIKKKMVDEIVNAPGNGWTPEEQGRKAAPKRGTSANPFDNVYGEESRPPGWMFATVELDPTRAMAVTAAPVRFFPTRNQASNRAFDIAADFARGQTKTLHVFADAGDVWKWHVGYSTSTTKAIKRPNSETLRKLERRLDKASGIDRTPAPKKPATRKAAPKRSATGPAQPTLFGRKRSLGKLSADESFEMLSWLAKRRVPKTVSEITEGLVAEGKAIDSALLRDVHAEIGQLVEEGYVTASYAGAGAYVNILITEAGHQLLWPSSTPSEDEGRRARTPAPKKSATRKAAPKRSAGYRLTGARVLPANAGRREVAVLYMRGSGPGARLASVRYLTTETKARAAMAAWYAATADDGQLGFDAYSFKWLPKRRRWAENRSTNVNGETSPMAYFPYIDEVGQILMAVTSTELSAQIEGWGQDVVTVASMVEEHEYASDRRGEFPARKAAKPAPKRSTGPAQPTLFGLGVRAGEVSRRLPAVADRRYGLLFLDGTNERDALVSVAFAANKRAMREVAERYVRVDGGEFKYEPINRAVYVWLWSPTAARWSTTGRAFNGGDYMNYGRADTFSDAGDVVLNQAKRGGVGGDFTAWGFSIEETAAELAKLGAPYIDGGTRYKGGKRVTPEKALPAGWDWSRP